MQPQYQTPGVYIVEKDAFPNTIVEVATAIPAFIGYTQQATFNGKNLTNIPTKLGSLKEFEEMFGGGKLQQFNLTSAGGCSITGNFTGGNVNKGSITTTPTASIVSNATINTAVFTAANVTGDIASAILTMGHITGYLTAGQQGTTALSAGNITAGTIIDGTITVSTADGEPTAITITNATISGATVAGNTIPNGTNITGVNITGVTTPITDITATSPAITKSIAITQGIITVKSSTPTTVTGDISGGSITGVTITTNVANATVKQAVISGNVTNGNITGGELAVVAQTSTPTPPDLSTAYVSNATITGPIAGNLTAGTVASTSTPPSTLSPDTLTFASSTTNPSQTATSVTLSLSDTYLFRLYNSIRIFYLNGGATCYIVSVGGYNSTPQYSDFTTGIDLLIPEQDPTMLLCPDALLLTKDIYYDNVVTYMLAHCAKVQNRVALFDVYGGDAPGTPPKMEGQSSIDIDNFRNGVGDNFLNYGIAYFPWVNSSIVSATDVTFLNLTPSALSTIANLNPNYQVLVKNAKKYIQPLGKPAQIAAANNSLLAGSPEYALTMKAIAAQLNILPVAPAMAGVYTTVDNTRGVWKAPANVSLNAVASPNVAISHDQQQNLNVDAVSGKSINAIRTFKGLGTMVWGARTLDGNSQDWRYINVRRTLIMIEESIKLSMRKYVFEPNDANTWTTVKSMINSFLFTLWKQGALPGATPADAFQVSIGLGTTMTGDDILNGIMNVSVLVVLDRPAEFIVLTFQQEMQKS